ncbi:MAG: carboxypeptidase [Leptonema illini]|jgi:hypothetical protein|uniref:Carboxypeptidase n=1 Tax=Leptonema illini TaxID=183 RepID=A0A833H0B0_9LEPT|nr:MAG: carboxypeptidase [Leptonema illini]
MLRGLRRLNRYEKRMLDVVKKGKGLVRLKQIGFSRKTKEGFRFPIHALEIGTPSALRKHPAGLVAGVHGLEIIGIQILLDFIESIVNEDFVPDIRKGKIGLHCIPVINPGGVALKRRSNPGGVDLMRNSGVEAVDPLPFFGGHRISRNLPYFRGQGLEPESRALTRWVLESFFEVKNSLIPVVDLHSGFGSVDHVWWPYAGTHDPCIDTPLFQKLADRLRVYSGHDRFRYGPQSESYTTHGDLWDRLYNQYQVRPEASKLKSRFLPLTLEVGTWTELREKPSRMLDPKNIFNPPPQTKSETVIRYRRFLRDTILLAREKPGDRIWN